MNREPPLLRLKAGSYPLEVMSNFRDYDLAHDAAGVRGPFRVAELVRRPDGVLVATHGDTFELCRSESIDRVHNMDWLAARDDDNLGAEMLRGCAPL